MTVDTNREKKKRGGNFFPPRSDFSVPRILRMVA